MALPQDFREAFRGFLDPEDPSPPPSGSGDKGLALGYPPDRFDWRGHGVLSPLRFQGNCNTCTSYASAAVIEAVHRIQGRANIRLAPGFIHRCLLQLECEQGAGAREVLPAVKSYGVALGFPGDEPFPPANCNTNDLFTISTWGWLEAVDDVLAWVGTVSPVIADLYVGRHSFPDLASGDVYSLPAGEEKILHSVAVVGYDRPQGWALVQNSFGSSWADGGFGRIAIGSGDFLDYRGGYRVAA